MIEALAAFISLLALDYVWARYNVYCSLRKPTHAGFYAAMIQALNVVTVLLYINNWKLVFPMMLGAFIGTYLGVKNHK